MQGLQHYFGSCCSYWDLTSVMGPSIFKNFFKIEDPAAIGLALLGDRACSSEQELFLTWLLRSYG